MADGRSKDVPASSDLVPGWRAILTPQHAANLAVVCLGVWLHAADSLLVATMLPTIVADIGGSALIAWTIALYQVGTIVAGAASALLALRRGVRASMAGAAVLFAIGCVVSAMAPTMPVMLAGRLMQGLGGGGLVALAFVSVSILFPRPLIPRVIAAISALWGLSAFMGPLVGGLFVELGFWRGGFWVFAAQAFLLAILIPLLVRDAGEPERNREALARERLPWRRLAVLSAGIVAVAAAGIDVGPWRSPLFVGLGLGLLVWFLALDAGRGNDRLLPRRPISLRHPVGAGLTMIIAFFAAAVPIAVYGPLLIIGLHGASALVAGYVIACSSIGWTLAAVVVAGLAERHDRTMVLIGMLVISASVVAFLIVVPIGPVWLIAMVALAEGAGFGMAWTFILRRMTALAEPGEQERAASALPTLQAFGLAIGAAYVGILANAAGLVDQAGPSVLTSVSYWLFAGCLPLAALGLVACACFLRPAAVDQGREPAV